MSTYISFLSTLSVGFFTCFSGKGFGGFVATKKKPKIGNKREAMQKASRKANRSHKASPKQFPRCSLIHHQTQVVKAAYAAKEPIKKAPKPVVVVVFERPTLKTAIPALKRASKPSLKKVVELPILKKDKVVIKGVKSPKPSTALPTIIGNLALGSKAYKGAGRPTKGKKFPNKPRNLDRKPKSQAKKASKRCAHAAISNIQVGSHMSQLVSIAQAEGYKVSFANTGSSLGLVDHTSKEILVNTTNMALQEYVLAHELVHVGYSKGLVTELTSIHLTPYAQHQGDEYWKQVEGTYSSTEVFEEKLASYLMWMPEYVISLFTSSTTGEAPSESVGDVISNVSNQEKQMFDNLFAEFKVALATVTELDELNNLAISIFNEVASVANLSEYDLLWLGVDCLDEECFAEWTKDYHSVIAAAKAAAAFHLVNSPVFPKPVGDKELVFIGDFANHIQQKAAIKYCVDNKLHMVADNELEITLGKETISIGSLSEYKAANEGRDVTLEAMSNSDNARSIVNAITNCQTKGDLAAFITKFGNFEHTEGLKYKLLPVHTNMTYGHVEVDFEELTLITSREFFFRSKGYLLGYGEIDGQQLLALILITITGSNDQFWGQNYLDAYLNSITAVEEEQDVYGAQMEESQQLRVVRANTLAILKTEEYMLKYPYFQLRNNNTKDGVEVVANYYLSQKIPFFVDKIAMKRVIVGAGVTALYAAMDYENSQLKTILDSQKPGKLFTRAFQTLCIPASEGIQGLQKGAVKYLDSNLVLRHYHQDGSLEDITIKGEPNITITGDATFLINGSGVGLTWKPFSASCKKTLRDSFNGMSLKVGETLEQVKAELTDALNKVLEDPSIRTSGTHLINFRGRPMLEYGGLNQEFVTHKKWGASFEIRELGTSKTLDIKFTVVYIYTDKEAKGRGLGQKSVFKDANKTGALVYDSELNPVKLDVLLNAECLKGNASRLMQYAEFCRTMLETLGATPADYQVCLVGGHHPLAMEAIEGPELIQEGDKWIWTGNRTFQSLEDMNTPFYQWWVANTKTYYLVDMIQEYYFLWILLGRAGLQQEWDSNQPISQELLDLALSHEANQKVKLLNATTGLPTTKLDEARKYTGFVQVQEEFTGVRSVYIFQMELASIRECSNAGQSSTIQQIASVYAANATLGEALADGVYVKETNKEGKVSKLGYKTIDQENSIVSLVAMSQNDITMKTIGREFKPKSKLVEWTLKDLATWNNSVFNTGANAIYPANSDPYLAFYDHTAAKKFKPSILVNRIGLTEVRDENSKIKFTFMQALEGSAQNYSMNVGTGYNVSSVASCMAALARAAVEKGVANKEPKSTLANLVEELKLWGWVNALAWKTCYENAWLASYNEKGEKLSAMLHEYRKGYVIEDGKVVKTKADVIAEIKALLCKIEDIPVSNLKDKWVENLLWAYKIARAVSSVERKVNGVNKALYDLALKDEDVKFIAICGAFRRCDQGKFSNNEDLLANDDETGFGRSVWSLLEEYWGEAQGLLPQWMARKLWKAMRVHLTISDSTKAIDNREGNNNYQVDDDVLDRMMYDIDSNQASLAGTLDEDLLASFGIPTIQFEYANQDMSDPLLMFPVKKGGKLVLEERTDAMTQQGAFLHYTLYCPIKKVEKEDGTKGFVMDSDVPGGAKVNYGGSQCWLWKRNLTAKEVLQFAAIRYPMGAVISSEDEIGGLVPSFHVDFEAVLETGAFSKSGAATGFALNLTTFMVSMSRKAVEGGKERNESAFRKYGRNQISGLQGQQREMLKAGTLKKMGKSAKTKQGSKVQTTHSAPYLTTEHGLIPVFMLHPDDEVVKEGGYKTGDFASISRTPMIAKAYGVLVLSTDAVVGHLDVSGLVFALSNRGDGDGDPVDLAKENGHVSKEELIRLLGADVIKAMSIKF